jgi:uncharacterized protein YqjF (DUF2071 family)
VLKPFLTANWRYLAMLNFAVDPKLLERLVPAGTELDFHDDITFISVVGFMFLDTRVMGFPIPLHRNFEEVNLRFYVRRKTADGWRRGVAFIRELVPRAAIAVTARVFYGEPYSALPMRHNIVHRDGGLAVQYGWRRRKRWETLAMTATGEPQPAPRGSHEEFITEHYWGYTARGTTSAEYQVEHPRWKLWNADSVRFEADIAALYGPSFVETLTAEHASAFIAEGSQVLVRQRSTEPL